jgi:hypothetical protein
MFFTFFLKESMEMAVTDIGGGKYQISDQIYPLKINLTPRAPNAVAKGE